MNEELLGEPRQSMSQFEAEERRIVEDLLEEEEHWQAVVRTKSIRFVTVDRGYGTSIRVIFSKRGQRKTNVYFPSDAAVQMLLDRAGEIVAHVEDRSIFLELYPKRR